MKIATFTTALGLASLATAWEMASTLTCRNYGPAANMCDRHTFTNLDMVVCEGSECKNTLFHHVREVKCFGARPCEGAIFYNVEKVTCNNRGCEHARFRNVGEVECGPNGYESKPQRVGNCRFAHFTDVAKVTCMRGDAGTIDACNSIVLRGSTETELSCVGPNCIGLNVNMKANIICTGSCNRNSVIVGGASIRCERNGCLDITFKGEGTNALCIDSRPKGVEGHLGGTCGGHTPAQVLDGATKTDVTCTQNNREHEACEGMDLEPKQPPPTSAEDVHKVCVLLNDRQECRKLCAMHPKEPACYFFSRAVGDCEGADCPHTCDRRPNEFVEMCEENPSLIVCGGRPAPCMVNLLSSECKDACITSPEECRHMCKVEPELAVCLFLHSSCGPLGIPTDDFFGRSTDDSTLPGEAAACTPAHLIVTMATALAAALR